MPVRSKDIKSRLRETPWSSRMGVEHGVNNPHPVKNNFVSKLHNEELHNLYPSPNIIRMIM
jgi:hypothetical protein